MRKLSEMRFFYNGIPFFKYWHHSPYFCLTLIFSISVLAISEYLSQNFLLSLINEICQNKSKRAEIISLDEFCHSKTSGRIILFKYCQYSNFVTYINYFASFFVNDFFYSEVQSTSKY